MRHGGRFDTAFVPTETESGQALMLMNRDLPQRPLAFHLVFGSQDPARRPIRRSGPRSSARWRRC